MYDAKEKCSDKNSELRYNCIEDRSYFFNVQNENMLNQKKSAYVPVDDLINMH